MDIFDALLLGFTIGVTVCCFVAFILDFFPKKNKSIQIGKLYIHEGLDKDTYSFAFDCELEDVKSLDEVMLKIERKRAEDPKQLVRNLEHDIYGDILDED